MKVERCGTILLTLWILLANVNIIMENHHVINGKTHYLNYFDWAIFNSYVKLPERMELQRADHGTIAGIDFTTICFVIGLERFVSSTWMYLYMVR